MSTLWDAPVGSLPGVGSTREKALHKLGLETVGDLVTFYPRRYEDRTTVYPIARAPVEEAVCVKGTVTAPAKLSRVPGGRQIVRCAVADDTGALQLTFFNRPYVQKSLKTGEEYIFYGKIDLFGGRRQMVNPQVESAARPKLAGTLAPRYPLTAGLQNSQLIAWTGLALDACLPELPDLLPAAVREEHGLLDAPTACRQAHRPESWDAAAQARRRLSFEELFTLSLGLQFLRSRREEHPGVPLKHGTPAQFRRLLPFAPTAAQQRVMEECARDLEGAFPMNRLVQGDVGSGKTAIAAFALWKCAQSGCQGSMMAPTELLAQQHYATLKNFLEPAGITVALLTGSIPAAEKKRVRQGLADGSIQVAVGTHALFSKGVEFQKLALAVVDEQHRFGVDQRSALASQGDHPHLLVMSATPIPRTLALILYGDLDVSILDELPPGRQPVETYLVSSAKRQRMYGFVDKLVAQGRQGYIVCPAVEDDDTGMVDLKSVKEYTKELQTKVFPHLSVAFVHGQMKAADKEKVMTAFARGEVQVLVSTTVIEVGVDVPNAAVMVVENADRFGLSQLHQLRGRVGRGGHQSYCILVSDSKNPDTRARLKALCATADGFKIAEEDLKTRGPGDFFGSRQHGLPQLRLASLAADITLLTEAQRAAQTLLEKDPHLQTPENQPLLAHIRQLFAENAHKFN